MKLSNFWKMPFFRGAYHSCRQYQQMQEVAKELNKEYGIHISLRYTCDKWRECSVFEDKRSSRYRAKSWKDISKKKNQYQGEE